eukprot:8820931-Alexandrium_andersonii.AAC.1
MLCTGFLSLNALFVFQHCQVHLGVFWLQQHISNKVLGRHTAAPLALAEAGRLPRSGIPGKTGGGTRDLD